MHRWRQGSRVTIIIRIFTFSGEFDVETENVMKIPRCSNEDDDELKLTLENSGDEAQGDYADIRGQ